MKEIYTEIVIHASAETVWDIITDIESYKDWNPFIKEGNGKAIVGNKLVCRPEIIKGRTLTFHPIITQVDPPKVFAWIGHIGTRWIASGEHIFEIEKLKEERVRLIHRQKYKGILSPIMGLKILSKHTRAGFISMNQAIKKKAQLNRI